MSMPRTYSSVRFSGEDLSGDEGRAVTLDTGAHILLDGPTNQAGTQLVIPSGILVAGGDASGDRVTVVEFGVTLALAGTVCDPMEPCVAEYNTGDIVPHDTVATLDYQLGYFPDGCAAGTLGKFMVEIKRVNL